MQPKLQLCSLATTGKLSKNPPLKHFCRTSLPSSQRSFVEILVRKIRRTTSYHFIPGPLKSTEEQALTLRFCEHDVLSGTLSTSWNSHSMSISRCSDRTPSPQNHFMHQPAHGHSRSSKNSSAYLFLASHNSSAFLQKSFSIVSLSFPHHS